MLHSDRLENRCTGIISKTFALNEVMEDGLWTSVGLVSISGEDNRGYRSLVKAFEENFAHLLERDELYSRVPKNLGYKSYNSLERVLFNRLPQHPDDTIGVHSVIISVRVPVLEERIRVRREGPHGQ